MESINFETFLLHLQPPTLKVQDTNKHVLKWIFNVFFLFSKIPLFQHEIPIEETDFYLTTHICDFSIRAALENIWE